MSRVFKSGAVEIWQIQETYGPDFYVYVGERLIGCYPSIGMAHEMAAGQ
jgi:hypothetical protein